MVNHKSFYEIANILFLISWLIIVLPTLTVLIITMCYWRHQWRSVVNLLMCNSCSSLLFFAITYSIQAPSFIQQIYFDAPEPNPLFCKISACLATFSTGVVAHSCIVQALSRFFITVLYKHQCLLTFRTHWVMIITSWVANGVFAVGMLLSPSAYQYNSESHLCILTTHNFLTSVIASIIFVAVTVIILVILYGIILRHTIYHTRINPHSTSTLRARRNKRVFQNVAFAVGIHAFGGIPYIICLIMNHMGQAPWSLQSVAVLSLSFTAGIHGVFLLSINDPVKGILFEKLTGQRTTPSNTTGTKKRNQVTPCLVQVKIIQVLPIIN